MVEYFNEVELRTDAIDLSFGEIVNLHRSKEVIISPEYQRLFRWTIEQRSRLIESIFVQLPIPPIFLIENEDGVLELIDGLQRVSSVMQFIDADSVALAPLQLTGCELVQNLNGITFNALPLADRLRLKRTGIRANIIRRKGDSFIKYELFKRLNTGGSLLSAQEVRNCSSRMVDGGREFYSTIQKLAQSEDFVGAIARLPDSLREMRGDEELVLRFFALKDFLNGYHGNVQEWLDDYMESVLFKKVDFNIEKQEKIFNQVFAAINSKVGGNAFARSREGGAQGRLAPAYFEAVVGAACRKLQKIEACDPAQFASLISQVFESENFRANTGPGANTREKLNKRIQIFSDAIDNNL